MLRVGTVGKMQGKVQIPVEAVKKKNQLLDFSLNVFCGLVCRITGLIMWVSLAEFYIAFCTDEFFS